MVRLPQSGPQRSEFSAGTVFRFPPLSFPPQKRGPRNRGGAAVAGAGLSAVGSPPARCPSGFKKKAPSVPRRLWWFDDRQSAVQGTVVAGGGRAPGKRGRGKRGAQEPRWCGCHRAVLSAVSFPPVRCSGSRPVRSPRKSGGLGTAVEPLSRERASAQWALRRRDVRVVLKRKHPPCRGGCGGLMSFWLPASAQWSLGPGVRRENEG